MAKHRIPGGASSYRFRGIGVLLGLIFHIAMFALAFASSNALVGGYRFLLTWYMPSIVLGLPWSIPALLMDAVVPGVSILGLMAAVCFNGYLLGWPLDAVENRRRREQRRKILESYTAAALGMPQLESADPVTFTNR